MKLGTIEKISEGRDLLARYMECGPIGKIEELAVSAELLLDDYQEQGLTLKAENVADKFGIDSETARQVLEYTDCNEEDAIALIQSLQKESSITARYRMPAEGSGFQPLSPIGGRQTESLPNKAPVDIRRRFDPVNEDGQPKTFQPAQPRVALNEEERSGPMTGQSIKDVIGRLSK